MNRKCVNKFLTKQLMRMCVFKAQHGTLVVGFLGPCNSGDPWFICPSEYKWCATDVLCHFTNISWHLTNVFNILLHFPFQLCVYPYWSLLVFAPDNIICGIVSTISSVCLVKGCGVAAHNVRLYPAGHWSTFVIYLRQKKPCKKGKLLFLQINENENKFSF